MTKIEKWPTRSDAFIDVQRQRSILNVPMKGANMGNGKGQETLGDTGGIVHGGLAALNTFFQAQKLDPVGIKQNRYAGLLKVAEGVADYAVTMQDSRSGGVRHGPFGKRNDPKDQRFGFDPQAPEMGHTVTMEHQGGSWLILKTLSLSPSRFERAGIYGKASERILQLVVGTMWDSKEKLFHGALDLKTNSLSNTFPLDAQVWPVSEIGVKNLLSAKAAEDDQPRIQIGDLVAHFSKIDQSYSVVNSQGTRIGYSFLPGQNLMTPEWSWQVVAAKAEFAAYLRDNPEVAEAAGVKWQDYATQAGETAGQLIKIDGKAGANGYAYAYQPDGTPAIGADTLLIGKVQPARYVIGTAYALSVLQGWDPAALKGGNIKSIVQSKEFLAGFSAPVKPAAVKPSAPIEPDPTAGKTDLINLSPVSEEFSGPNWRSRHQNFAPALSFNKGDSLVITVNYDPKMTKTLAVELRRSSGGDTSRPEVLAAFPIVPTNKQGIGTVTVPILAQFKTVGRIVYHYGQTAYNPNNFLRGNNNDGKVTIDSVLLQRQAFRPR